MSDENINQISMDWEEGGGNSGTVMCVHVLGETDSEERSGDEIERDSASGALAAKCSLLKIQ